MATQMIDHVERLGLLPNDAICMVRRDSVRRFCFLVASVADRSGNSISEVLAAAGAEFAVFPRDQFPYAKDAIAALIRDFGAQDGQNA